MKKTLFLLCLILILFTTSCSKSLVDDYPKLPGDHVFKVLTPEQLNEKLDNGDSFVVVLGFAACPWCQQLLPVVNEVCNEHEFKEIYYCDIKDMRDNADSKDRKYYNRLTVVLKDAMDTEKNRINAPTTVSISDGKLVMYNRDTVPSHVKDESNTLPALSSIQKIELKAIISSIINSIL